MRNGNLISMIYANLEKTSAAAEKAAQTKAYPATPGLVPVTTYGDTPAPLTTINNTNTCLAPRFRQQNTR